MRTLVSVLPRRLGHIGLVGMLVLVGSITNGAGASAAETKPCEAPTVESFHQFKVEAVKAKYSDHAIKRKISERWCSLVDITIPMNDPIGTMTSPGDVDWTGMSIFWDNQVGKYYATADWHWTNQGFIDHDYVTCIDNEIGYNDGVGIRFSGGDLNMLGEAASAWGNPAKDSWYRDYGFMIVDNSQSGEYGAGFIDADKATRLEVTEDGGCALGQYDYNMWGGTVTIGFKPLNGCRNVQMYPGYIHTWTSTGITSLGAGPWSFSISWDNPGNSWEKSESGPSAYVCA